MTAKAALCVVAASLVSSSVGCNAILGIGDPVTDSASGSSPGGWPKTGTRLLGPTRWTPVFRIGRSSDNTPSGTQVNFTAEQKARLLSQLPATMDDCKPCPNDPAAGFYLRVFSDGALADRLQTCDALNTCLGEVFRNQFVSEAPPDELLVKIVPK